MRFRSKPSEIEAIHWRGKNVDDVVEFGADDSHSWTKVKVSDGALSLLAGARGAQEWVPVPVGHWLVCQPGDKSDIWPVDPDYFNDKYEYIDD